MIFLDFCFKIVEWHSRGHGFDPHRLHQKKPLLRKWFFYFITLYKKTVEFGCITDSTIHRLINTLDYDTILLMKGGVSMTSKECGEFISLLRKENNLTQKQLAERINVTDKAVSRWETGKGYPDITSLIALSEFFGISVNELLAGKRISDESVKEVADENIISVIKESKKLKLKSFATAIVTYISMCIVCFVSGLLLTTPGADPITAVIAAAIVCIGLCIAGTLLARYQPKKVLLAFCLTIVSAWLIVPSFYFVSLYLLERLAPSIILEILSLMIMAFGIPGFMFLNIMNENLNSNPVFIYFVVAMLCAVVPVIVTYLSSKSKRDL